MNRATGMGRRAVALLCVAYGLGAGCSAVLSPSYATSFVAPAKHGIRDVRIVLVLDDSWRGRDIEAQRLVARASQRWEEEFGIRFNLVSLRWKKVPAFTATAQVRKLRDELRVEVETDVVVLFSASLGLVNPEAAEVLGNYVVVAPGLWDSSEYLLYHGLGHIFGAGHRVTPNQVMSFYVVPFLSRGEFAGFSDATRETVAANKWRRFDQPETPTAGPVGGRGSRLSRNAAP